MSRDNGGGLCDWVGVLMAQRDHSGQKIQNQRMDHSSSSHFHRNRCCLPRELRRCPLQPGEYILISFNLAFVCCIESILFNDGFLDRGVGKF